MRRAMHDHVACMISNDNNANDITAQHLLRTMLCGMDTQQ